MTGAGDGRVADIDFSDGAVRDRLRAFLTTASPHRADGHPAR